MKQSFIITAFLIGLTYSTAIAQATDPIKAKIAYSYSLVEDTTNRDKPYKEEMILLLGKNASVYTSMDKILQDEMRKKEIAEQMKNSTTSNYNIQLKSPSKRTNSTVYYQFANEKKLFVKQRLVNYYLIEEPLPAIDWSISTDTASYSGLVCQKATAHFKGRNYTAWFCPNIPFQSGPWKLNGLPGLIIEAYDTNKEVVFKFNGFETVTPLSSIALKKPAADNQPKPTGDGRMVVMVGIDQINMLEAGVISLPKDAIKTTQKEFDKLKEVMKKDPAGFYNSSMAGSGVIVKTRSNATSTNVNKGQTNNPLELPEK